MAVLHSASVSGSETAAPKAFTVADSIRMTHLLDPHEQVPGAQAKTSPDGNHFFVLTEKGILETNVREYTILVFDRSRPETKPQVVARFQSSSNRDGISQVKWLDNSRLCFIGENPNETPQVYVVSVRDNKLHKLTSDARGILAYDVSQDLKTVVYYAEWAGDKDEEDAIEKKEQHGFAVTNETLFELLYDTWKKPQNTFQLKILNRSNGQVRCARGLFKTPLGRLQVKLSPSGRYAATEQPAFEITGNWKLYKQRYFQMMFSSAQNDKAKIRNHGFYQTMFVDTKTAEIRPLLDSPTYSKPSFSWSTDERSISIAGAFVPLRGGEGEDLQERESKTALVEVQLPNFTFTPIAYIPVDQFWQIDDEQQGEEYTVQRRSISGDDINPTISSIEYRKKNGRWEYVENKGIKARSTPSISVALDRRPKLTLKDEEGKEQVILDPNPDFDKFAFGRAEVIRWTGKKGEALNGGLIYPTNYQAGQRYPLVIQTHGFSAATFLVDGPFTTSFAAQELANHGVAVLQIGQSPLYDQTRGTSDWGPVQLSQIESGIDYLEARGIVDRRNVALVGFSITGYIVWYALTHSSYQFQAATASEGNDYGYWAYLADMKPSWAAQTESPYGGPPWGEKLQIWIRESISFNYDKVHTPIRIESEANPGQIMMEWENFAALRRLNKPVDFIYETHGYHPVVKPWDRFTSQQGNVDWLIFWLKGVEDPDPAKREQYARWNELRKLNQANLGGMNQKADNSREQ